MSLWAFFESFNNRERAIVVWLLLFSLWILFRKDTRVAVFNVLKAFFDKKIISIVLGMLLYTSLIVFSLYKLRLWNAFLLKDTIFWVIGTALVLLFNTNKAMQNASFFKDTVLNAFKLVVILEFVINFYTLNFWLEMVLIPTLVIIGGMSALTEIQAEYKTVKRFINSLLAIIGFLMVIYATGNVVANYQTFVTLKNLNTLVLPPLLTLFYIPYLYFFALIMAYETLFVRLGIFVKDKHLLDFTKQRVFLLCNLNLGKLNLFARTYTREFMEFNNKSDVKKLISNFQLKNK
ncbi:MAG: hypothetical protein WC826_05150 [Microgenomates group bacterium]|jgi:hypothetical protein